MKQFSTIAAAVLMTAAAQHTAFGKTNADDLLKAKYLYTHLAFNEAIPYYEKVAATSTDPEVFAQLGDCYRLIKDPQKAAGYYAKAVAMSGVQPITKLHYAQTLMTLQKYDEAIPMLQQYQQQFPADRRAANLIKGAEMGKSSKGGIPQGSAKFLSCNTDGNEFGPVMHQGDLIITADTVVQGRNKTDKWTGNSFYNIYAIKTDSSGNMASEFRKVGDKLNSKFHDGPISFTADGKDAFFTRTNFVQQLLVDNARKDGADVVHLQIIVASGYDNASGKFDNIKPFPFNSKNYSSAHPAISPSGNVLVFASDMPNGSGGTDLYLTKKDAAGAWSTPVNLGKSINTEGEEIFPYLKDDQTLYFASDGWAGLGGFDLYRSSWSESDQAFSMPEHLGMPVNSSYDDVSYATAADGASGFFASNRPAAKGGDNIYLYNSQEVYLKLELLDAQSGKPVSAVNVSLESIVDKRAFSTTSAGGLFTRIYPQANYTLKLSRLGYQTQIIDLATASKMGNDTIRKSIKMVPNTQISYQALILDRKTLQPIDKPMLVITKVGSAQKADTISAGPDVSFSVGLQANGEYQVYAVKTDYYSDEKFISTKGIIPGSNDKIRDTIFMKKLEVGAVIRIENIYYDYDKANVREDAKPSLNRLFELMQQSKGMAIQINSHTDCRGSDVYNKKLSEARAASVVKFLNQKGIESSRMQSKGFGESAPVDQCSDCSKCSEAQHQQNRRTEFQILKM